MKISYKVLKRYIPDIASPEKIAQDLIMHTAEVEGIHSETSNFEHIVYGTITKVSPHENADSLRVCMVDVGESEDIQIVCGGSNLEVGQGVAIAKIGASVLWHGQGEPVIMKKTAIRGVESYGMICASEEIGLGEEFPAKDSTEILDLSAYNAKAGTNLAQVLGKDDVILEIDNKAINHRPDLFSHIGVAREIEAIQGKKLSYTLVEKEFSHYPKLEIQNTIPEYVKRYLGVKVENVANIASPEYILEVIGSHGIESKGLLVDISNYSLYLYGQPTHCFDADKISGKIQIRFAKSGEKFLALNDKLYELSSRDIVIADDEKVLALGGVIGGKSSAISQESKNIVIESAWFDQAIVRQTGKRLGLRTDALNVFEKELVHELSHIGASLILGELETHFPEMKIVSANDIYEHIPKQKEICMNLSYIQNLIGVAYNEERILEILACVGIEKKADMLIIPLWRKDINHLSDIAEEVARLDGYENIPMSVPKIALGAIHQSPLYKAKRDIRNFLCAKGYFEMYTYSFINQENLEKALGNIEQNVPLKNALSEEQTHMRASLVPNLLAAYEENPDQKDLKMFEFEKVFQRNSQEIQEYYELAALFSGDPENAFYESRNLLDEILQKLGIFKYELQNMSCFPSFFHSGRCAGVFIRGKIVGYIGEIHPRVLDNYGISGRIGCVCLNMSLLKDAMYTIVEAKDISAFQENNFDLNFVVEKETSGAKIAKVIQNTDALIQRVELIDIYESEEKLPGKRSLTFKIFIQSFTGTLGDEVKNTLIEKIVKNVEKVGGKLR